MANTYTQNYVQIIFTVNGKYNFIQEKHREQVEKYICGVVNKNKSKPLAIYCNPDHVHILIGLHPSISISDMTRDIKAGSSHFINEGKFLPGLFKWQDGFGSFTYSRSQIDSVVKYILNQPVHHKRRSFREEYLSILEKLDIKYDEQYLFEWY
jgi:putative transposase